ncbi:hypothetical protein RVBP17_0560 [Pseudomonas phage sp. 30-3]|uniref:Uncharacterized protein n=1 Tax=Pseudomonas phage vB_PaeM_PA5oct TaxID=2163605 RepID=A0A4Y5JXC8_9CAUD|nr:RusA-like Holliday junction resolvase [Pseudomonas phage vB_PaeM_PA5oct]WMI32094.1 hypothetical protein GBBBJNDB_00403 [Pseudomonas phage Callisto]WPK39132.1 RusA-like Holliday junction resolvase [Pseudomonas phage Cassandra]WPK39644.1 RusA-like Holliday junction resolvase [Pseudomonas phage Deifobo]WPK40165.1 RusA-like Holliday junction resolvase [Pseudomonas phage Ettore]WPK40680.1 RusA-like Holliday junction resolvase [Pseudomonas phage Paride]VOH56177.1 D14 protein/putative resolvase [
MSGSKSKIKGSSWERDVAKDLTSFYNEPFTRTAHSGAFIGGQNSVRKTSLGNNQIKSYKGDIFPPDTWEHFNSECKSYAKFSFTSLFEGECKQLDTWISQVRDTASEGDFNIIFIKITRQGKWVVFEEKTGIKVNNSIDYKGWVFCSWNNFWTEENKEKVKQLSK